MTSPHLPPAALPAAAASEATLPPHRPEWFRAWRGLAGLVALGAIAAWGFTVGRRVASPFPVEWQEGAITNHVFRMLDGLPIYTAPSSKFIPALYPPFGYLVEAGAMALIGRGLPAARAVSVIASIGIAALMAAVIRRATRSGFAALLAVGLFFAAYVLCRDWYDQARVDMLFVLLGFTSLVLLDRPGPSAARAACAGLAAALACLTKQHGLVFAAAGLAFLLLRAPRRALLFCAAGALAAVPAMLWLERASGGWFLREIWTFIFRYPLRPDYLPRAIAPMVQLTIPLGFAVAWAVLDCRGYGRGHGRGAARGAPRGGGPDGTPRSGRLRPVSVWTLALAGLVPATFVSLLHDGATVNHAIPLVAVALTMQGFLIGDLDCRGSRPAAVAALIALALIPFALWPQPFGAVPAAATRAAQATVVGEIRAFPGDVLVLEDSFYGWLAGRPMNPDGASFVSLSQLGFRLPQDLVDALTARRFGAVFISYRVEERDQKSLHTESARYLNRLIYRNYAFSHTLVPEGSEIARLRIPIYVYLPQPPEG